MSTAIRAWSSTGDWGPRDDPQVGGTTTRDAIAALERCGIELARVPAGDYPVGFDGDGNALLARPPQWIFGPTPRATAPQRVAVSEFLIAVEPLRLSHLQAVETDDWFRELRGAIPDDHRARAESLRATDTTVDIEPTYDELQYAFAADEPTPQPRPIACDPEPDPVVDLPADVAQAVARGLGGRVPLWHEWEVAVRGPDGLRYPWGDVLDRAELSIEDQDYSVDDESTMGYYSYDQHVLFVHSFGRYTAAASPFGLRGLGRAGREWNACVDGEPTAASELVLRSLSDLGAMARMIPGIRHNTYGVRGWHTVKRRLAFSGPMAAAWAVPDDVFDTGALRLVVPV